MSLTLDRESFPSFGVFIIVPTVVLTRSFTLAAFIFAALALPSTAGAAALTPSGTQLAKAFGDRGYTWVSPRGHGAGQETSGIVPAPDGSVYVLFWGGEHKKSRSYEPVLLHTKWFVLRFLNNGRLDPRFRELHGRVSEFESTPKLESDSKGRVLLTSYGSSKSSRKRSRIEVRRYSVHGKPDKSFGSNGTSSFAYPQLNEAPFVKPTADGGAWLAVSTNSSGSSLTRLGKDGSPLGRPVSMRGNARCWSSGIRSVAPMRDGSAVVSCFGPSTEPDEPSYEALVRIRADGSLATGWANGGRFVIDADPPGAKPFLDFGFHGTTGFRELPGGRLSLSVVSGAFSVAAIWAARLTPDGKYDTSYGAGGSAELMQTATGEDDENGPTFFRTTPAADGSWILSSYTGTRGGFISASTVSPSGIVTPVFSGNSAARLPGEFTNAQMLPVPSVDGKSLYGYLNADASSDKSLGPEDQKRKKLRTLIYRLRLK